MAVRSTQCQNRAVRSTQGGRGVSPSSIDRNETKILLIQGQALLYIYQYFNTMLENQQSCSLTGFSL